MPRPALRAGSSDLELRAARDVQHLGLLRGRLAGPTQDSCQRDGRGGGDQGRRLHRGPCGRWSRRVDARVQSEVAGGAVPRLRPGDRAQHRHLAAAARLRRAGSGCGRGSPAAACSGWARRPAAAPGCGAGAGRWRARRPAALCVYGCCGRANKPGRRRGLDDAAEVHHGHAVAQELHHREVVRDEQVAQPKPLLQRHQQVEHLRLDRHVQRRQRLVEHHHLRLQRQRARDADALALAARELVRLALQVLRVQADELQQFDDAALALGAAGQAVHIERQARGCGRRAGAG